MDVAEPTPSSPAPPEEPLQDTLYSKVRWLAVLSKVLGAFPFQHSRERDGRKLQYSWKTKIIIWDMFLFAIIMFAFITSCNHLLFSSLNGGDVSIWLFMTCYTVALRGLVQFVLLHFFAARLPKLFTALENYHQTTGSSIIKSNKSNWYGGVITVLCTVGILIALEIVSLLFFTQLDNENIFLTTAPVAITFLFANLWKELPMNMFVLLCMYLTARFREISDEVRQVREREKDAAVALDQLRLQHAALVDIVMLLQGCYGTQLAANLLFLLLDTILQLFVFFTLSARRNVFLLVLSLYYFVMCTVVLAIVEQLQRTDEAVLKELAAFQQHSTSKDQKMQIQLFTSQIAARPVGISASGYFLVNNGLVASLLGAIATYLVVMIQIVPRMETSANSTMSFL